MMKQMITCDAKTNKVTSEWVEDNSPEYIDYQAEIAACKQRLAQTDYAVIKIAEGAAEREEYADIIAERVALREKIAELERMQSAQQT